MFRYLVIFLFAACFCSTPLLAQKTEKAFFKAEELHRKGKYEKALKSATKLKKTIVKKEGDRNAYYALVSLKMVKYRLSLGFADNMEIELKQAIALSEEVNGPFAYAHLLILMEAAEVWMDYGNWQQAYNLLSKAYADAAKFTDTDASAMAKFRLQYAVIQANRGFLKEALKLATEIEPQLRNRMAESTMQILDKKGLPKTVKISAEESRSRKIDYADLLNAKANMYRLQGNFNSTDSALMVAEKWIGSQLGKKDLAYVRQLYLTALLMDEHGVKKLPGKLYDKALETARKSLDPHHQICLEIHRSKIRYFIREQDKRAKFEKSAYQKHVGKRYKTKSIPVRYLALFDLETRFNEERLKQMDGKIMLLLEGKNELPEHPMRLELLELGYKAMLAENNYKKAEYYLKKLIEGKRSYYGEDAPFFHLTKIQLAIFVTQHADDFQLAGEIFKQSFTEKVQPQIHPGHVDYIAIHNAMAEWYEANDQYQAATQALESALLAARKKYDDKDVEYGLVLEKIASIQISMGLYEIADKNLQASGAILTKIKDKEYQTYLAKYWETQARLYFVYGQFDDAEAALSKADKAKSKASLISDRADLDAINNLAGIYLETGKYAKTEKLLSQSIQEKERDYGLKSRKLIVPLTLYSRYQLAIGDYTEAEKTVSRAMQIAESAFGKQSVKLAPAHLQLAEIYIILGDYEKAETQLRMGITNLEQNLGKEHIETAMATSRLGNVLQLKGEPFKVVEPLFLQSERVIEAKLGRNSPRYAELLKDMATVYISNDRIGDAFLYLDRAEKIWEAKLGRRNNIKAASIYTLKGDIFYIQSEFAKAEEQYLKAQTLYNRFFSKNHPEYIKVQSKLAKVYYMNGDLKKSKSLIENSLENYNAFIDAYFPALSEREKAKYWNTIKEDYEFYQSLALRMSGDYPDMIGKMYDNALKTKAILLSSSIKMRERIQNSNDEELKALYNNWLYKKELLTVSLSMTNDQLAENEINPGVLRNEVEKMEKMLSEKSELFKQSFDSKKITWQNVRSSLKENEVAIEMLRFRHFDKTFTDSVVYVAAYTQPGKEKYPEIITLPHGTMLESRYLSYYRNAIKYKLKDHISYQIFWKPIVDRVGATASIYLSADGVYNQINLEAMRTPDDRFVIDNSNIVLVSNTKDLYLRAARPAMPPAAKTAYMFGNPIFYIDENVQDSAEQLIAQLPGTKKEVEELKELFLADGWSTNYFLEKNATEDQVKLLNSPKVFHVATHGFFESGAGPLEASIVDLSENEFQAYQNPLFRSGLMLTGAGDVLAQSAYNFNVASGILTAYEAMNLNLDYTELVVLSACETGLGEQQAGEGVYGLQRAFLVAGARTLIMSLFKVNDEATQQLMVKFYRNWLQTGDKRQAFIAAKKELRDTYQHPIYWAAFVMIGLD